jgi:O-antigen ligase
MAKKKANKPQSKPSRARRKKTADGTSLPGPRLLDWGDASESILGDTREVAPIIEDAPSVVRPEPEPQELADLSEEGEPPRPVAQAEETARWLLAAAVFLVPIVFHPETIDAFNLTKITVLWILLVGATAAWLVGVALSPQRFTLPRGPLITGSLALLGITALATALSPNRTLSFFGLYHRYEGLISLVLYVWTLLLIVFLYRRHIDRLRELLRALGIASAVVSAYVLLQTVGLDPFEWRGATGVDPSHPVGALGNAAFTASFLGIAAPVVVYLASTARTRATRVGWLAVGGLIVVSIFATQGRGGMFAAAAGLGAFALFQSGLEPWRKVGSVVVLLLVLGLFPVFAPRFIDPLGSDSRVGHRTDIWTASVKTAIDKPFLGWGPESFYGQHSRFRTATEAREHGLGLSDKPHNIFLSWATSTGLAGLATYLLVVGLALFAVAGESSSKGTARRLLLSSLGAALVAYLVQGLYSVDIPPLALTGWLILAGIATTQVRVRRKRVLPLLRPMGKTSGSLVPAAISVTAAALALSGLAPIRADHAAWEAERRGRSGWSSSVLSLYESAVGLNPRESAYLGLQAFYLERVAPDDDATVSGPDAYRRAVSLYERAASVQPGNLQFMIGAARASLYLGQQVDPRYFEDGDRWLSRAVARDPLDPQIYDLHADLLRVWAEARAGEAAAALRARARSADEEARRLRSGSPTP